MSCHFISFSSKIICSTFVQVRIQQSKYDAVRKKTNGGQRTRRRRRRWQCSGVLGWHFSCLLLKMTVVNRALGLLCDFVVSSRSIRSTMEYAAATNTCLGQRSKHCRRRRQWHSRKRTSFYSIPITTQNVLILLLCLLLL